MKKHNGLNLEIIILSIILFLAVIGFIIRKQYNFLYNSIIIYIGYCLLIYFEYKKNLRLKNYARILVIMTALLHNIFGQYFNLYKATKWFDKALHVFGTFSFAILSYSIIELFNNVCEQSKIITVIMIISMGIALGVFLENIEFVLDIIMKTKNQHGLNDINLDLIFNVIGAGLAGIFITLRKKKSPY